MRSHFFITQTKWILVDGHALHCLYMGTRGRKQYRISLCNHEHLYSRKTISTCLYNCVPWLPRPSTEPLAWRSYECHKLNSKNNIWNNSIVDLIIQKGVEIAYGEFGMFMTQRHYILTLGCFVGYFNGGPDRPKRRPKPLTCNTLDILFHLLSPIGR